MKLENIQVRTREEKGKGAARRTRAAGDIPAVLYGEGKAPVSLFLNEKAFRLMVQHAGAHALVELEVAGRPELSGPTILKQVQRHPVSEAYLHADFMRIDLDKRIHTKIPVVLIGRSAGVILGGVLEHNLREIEVECLALDTPSHFDVDVSELEIGDSLHLSDISMPENVTMLTPGERTLATVHAPRVIEEPTTTADEEEEEGAPAEEEEGAESKDTEEKDAS